MTFVGVLISLLIIEVFRRKNKVFTAIIISLGTLITICFCIGLYLFFQPQKLKISLDKLPWVTEDGNRYFYHWNNLELENGYPLYYFLCQEEMRENWNQRSSFPYDSLDRKGQSLEATIIFYLTSKGVFKDGAAIRKLKAEDIRNIENGIPSILATNGGFMDRLSGLKNELLYTNDPNGQSVSQRFIYWKTGLKIIQKNWGIVSIIVPTIFIAFPLISIIWGNQFGNNNLATLNGRTQLWTCVTSRWEEFLPFGVGVQAAFPNGFCSDDEWFSKLRHPENMFLLNYVESGILGLMGLVVLFVVTFWASGKALAKGSALPMAITTTFFMSSIFYVPLFHYLPFLESRTADRGVFNFFLFTFIWMAVLAAFNKQKVKQ
jgi:hypothetical protein